MTACLHACVHAIMLLVSTCMYSILYMHVQSNHVHVSHVLILHEFTLFPGNLDCTQRRDGEHPGVTGENGHCVEPLPWKEQTRLRHLHTAVVAVLAAVEEHSEVHGSGEEVSDVSLCHWVRNAVEDLIGILDVRDGLRSELSCGPNTRAHDHETSTLLEDNGILCLLFWDEITFGTKREIYQSRVLYIETHINMVLSCTLNSSNNVPCFADW